MQLTRNRCIWWIRFYWYFLFFLKEFPFSCLSLIGNKMGTNIFSRIIVKCYGVRWLCWLKHSCVVFFFCSFVSLRIRLCMCNMFFAVECALWLDWTPVFIDQTLNRHTFLYYRFKEIKTNPKLVLLMRKTACIVESRVKFEKKKNLFFW